MFGATCPSDKNGVSRGTRFDVYRMVWYYYGACLCPLKTSAVCVRFPRMQALHADAGSAQPLGLHATGRCLVRRAEHYCVILALLLRYGKLPGHNEAALLL